jgi:virulence factor Mce-like protein
VIRTAIKFGGFVAICLAFTLWLAFTIGNISFEGRYELTATFDDVTGLLIDDNVKVAGVVVGKVTSVDVEKGRAVVTFAVKNSVKVPSDSTAAIRWRNLIGQRYIYLYPGDAATTLQDGDVVQRTKSVVDLGELFNRLGPIVAAIDPHQVNQFLDSFTKALDGREDTVSKALDDLAVLTKGLGERDAAIGRMVDNLAIVTGTLATRDAQIRSTLDNLTALSKEFSSNTGVLDAAITELGEFSHDLAFLLDDNRGEIDRLLSRVADITDVVGSRLGKLDVTLANLDQTARSIYLAGATGEFLNQTILCAAISEPDDERCDLPIVKEMEASASAQATPFGPREMRGSDALAALLGGDR